VNIRTGSIFSLDELYKQFVRKKMRTMSISNPRDAKEGAFVFRLHAIMKTLDYSKLYREYRLDGKLCNQPPQYTKNMKI